MVEWVRLYDSETGEVDSSWVRSVGWRKQTLILRRYEDNPEEAETYRYEDVPYETFELIKRTYERGDSVGSVVNKQVINNKTIPAAEKLEMGV